ncbi:hypothetical protein MRB53_006311 [Persea americana]|uniref:Uncharacterized protein n=1 Tax=Persea americana TaxID=3435 RepID=A0ACC2MGQ7_PERAE|nr:hypothetical protein MRB53_006311 [Persea americana]
MKVSCQQLKEEDGEGEGEAMVSIFVFNASLNSLSIYDEGGEEEKSSEKKRRRKGFLAKAKWALGILNCNNVILNGLKIVNGSGKHISIVACIGVHISQLTITAPGDSPNTDGIHIERSQHVEILSSTIGTGDDCISIGRGTSDVNISHINCGPGHGISIGSLGDDNSEVAVEQIHVSFCNFYNTMYAARIKTWQGGSGFARNIIFENLNFTNVDQAITIDQYYCNGHHNCGNQVSTFIFI